VCLPLAALSQTNALININEACVADPSSQSIILAYTGASSSPSRPSPPHVVHGSTIATPAAATVVLARCVPSSQHFASAS